MKQPPDVKVSPVQQVIKRKGSVDSAVSHASHVAGALVQRMGRKQRLLARLDKELADLINSDILPRWKKNTAAVDRFFNDEPPGVSVSVVSPSRQTSKQARKRGLMLSAFKSGKITGENGELHQSIGGSIKNMAAASARYLTAVGRASMDASGVAKVSGRVGPVEEV